MKYGRNDSHLVGRTADYICWNDAIKEQLAILRQTEHTVLHIHTDVHRSYPALVF